MQKRETHYERIILIVAALCAIGISVWLYTLANSFSEGLKTPPVPNNTNLGRIPVETVESATKALRTPFKPWIAPTRSNKPVPLNKAVLLVMKDNEIYDLFLEDKLLRPPMTNIFLRENNLNYLSPNVGNEDPDGDGFTNLEEFVGHTNPKDPNSHPPFTDKLFLVERIAHPYLLILKSSSAPYQVSITPPDVPRKGYFIDPSNPELVRFGPEKDPKEKRFEFVSFTAKKIPDPRLGEKDVSEMVIKDLKRGNQLVLVMNVEQNLAEYDAKFEFKLGSGKPFIVPKGQTFRLEKDPGTTYKVIDIEEDSAVISPVGDNGQTDKNKNVLIKKG